MIVIHCPLKQDFIVEVLADIKEISFTLLKKEGIRLYFEINTTNIEEAIALAKQKIKSTEIGNVLYFQVTAA